MTTTASTTARTSTDHSVLSAHDLVKDWDVRILHGIDLEVPASSSSRSWAPRVPASRRC